jgi:decaprenylphospho-beta-D-erythro-pentofuranosid-2-ulose 2-reductase
MKRILILGATSAIARACARRWTLEFGKPGGEGIAFFLVARDRSRLAHTAADLRARGAHEAHTHFLDMTDMEAHGVMLDAAWAALGGIDIVLIAYGTLPDQATCDLDTDSALREFAINGTSVIALMNTVAPRLEAQGHGTLAVITSVAGLRGRPSNYLYGSAKAAVTTYCEGLRARLFKTGVHVAEIRPGFVDTPMTRHLSLPALLVSTPEKVAMTVTRGISRQRNVIYTPRFWALIMLVIRGIPRYIFKRMRL